MKQKSIHEIVRMIQDGQLKLAVEHSVLNWSASNSHLAEGIRSIEMRYNLLRADYLAGRITSKRFQEESGNIGQALKEAIKGKRLQRILFMGANPVFVNPLALDTEVEKIEEALRRSQYRDEFVLLRATALRATDFARALGDHTPEIVHFSGHGTQTGLVLLDDGGGTHEVHSSRFGNLFAFFNQIQCLVLNACHSLAVAESIRPHIPAEVPIIAMSDKVQDQDAIEFAQHFYGSLGRGHSYGDAFRFAKAAIGLAGQQYGAETLLHLI